MISWSSMFSALGFFTIVMSVICVLRHFSVFVRGRGASVMLLAAGLATMRLLLPFEIPITYAVRSWNLFGVPQRYLHAHPEVQRTLLVAWAVGAVVFEAVNLLVIYCACSRCRKYAVADSEAVQRVVRRLGVKHPVLVSPSAHTAYVAGVFRYVICLPDRKLSEREVELILAHELQHIRTHDAQIKFFYSLLAAAFWWNLVVHWFRFELNRLLELRCDEKVKAGMNEHEQLEYTAMLLKMAPKRGKPSKRLVGVAFSGFRIKGKGGATEQRLRVLMARENKCLRRVGIVAQYAVVVLFFVSYLVIFQPAVVPSAEKFEEESGVYYYENYAGSEIEDGIVSTFIIKGSDGRYQLCVNYTFSRYLSEDEIASEKYQDLRIVEEGTQK